MTEKFEKGEPVLVEAVIADTYEDDGCLLVELPGSHPHAFPVSLYMPYVPIQSIRRALPRELVCPRCGECSLTRLPGQPWRCSRCPESPGATDATLVRVDDLRLMQEVFALARQVVRAFPDSNAIELDDPYLGELRVALDALRKKVGP